MFYDVTLLNFICSIILRVRIKDDDDDDDDDYTSSSSSLGSRCVPWLGEGLSMPSPNYPVLCFPLPYRVAPVFV